MVMGKFRGCCRLPSGQRVDAIATITTTTAATAAAALAAAATTTTTATTHWYIYGMHSGKNTMCPF